ncbi:MAG: hypothetical protein ABW007_09530 [Chitinophagaceae bacterium]
MPEIFAKKKSSRKTLAGIDKLLQQLSYPLANEDLDTMRSLAEALAHKVNASTECTGE